MILINFVNNSFKNHINKLSKLPINIFSLGTNPPYYTHSNLDQMLI
jgi:hypothetical protein